MRRTAIDPSLQRVVMSGFEFPLGVYPVEAVEPMAGYVVEFEASDSPQSGGEEGEEWEEWPDRFLFEAGVPAPKLRSVVMMLLGLLPERVYPILDVLGQDAYREVDPYIAYDLVGLDRVYEAVGQFGEWLFEDGLVGFGAMSMDPFLSVYVDEHKVVAVRTQLDLKEAVIKVMRAFDLPEIESVVAPDSAEHEHRGVLLAPEDRPELLSAEDIMDRLKESWRLELNIDPMSNRDDEGNELGVTGWLCLARVAGEEEGSFRWAELLLSADSYETARRMVEGALADSLGVADGELDVELVQGDRLTPGQYGEMIEGEASLGEGGTSRVESLRWLDSDQPAGGDAGSSSGLS